MATKIKTVGSLATLFCCEMSSLSVCRQVNNVWAQKCPHVYTFWLIESVKIYFESSLVIILLLFYTLKIPENLLTDLPAVTAELFNFCREINRISKRHCNPCQNSLERVANIKKAQEIQVVDKFCSNTSEATERHLTSNFIEGDSVKAALGFEIH